MLGQARESAIELRNKAEEHARRVVREAQETARELRTTTQQAVETEDPRGRGRRRATGPRRSWARRARCASGCSPTSRSAARSSSARSPSCALGRGKLVETYELVERALGHAARVMAEEPSTPPEVPDRRRRVDRGAGRRTDDAPTAAPLPATPTPDPDRRSRHPRPTSAVPDESGRACRCRVDDRVRRVRRVAPSPPCPQKLRSRVERLFEKLRSGQPPTPRADTTAAPDEPDDRGRRGSGRVRAGRRPRSVRRRGRRAGGSADEPERRPTPPPRARDSRPRRDHRRPRAPRASGPCRTSRTTCSTACAASGARSTSPRCCPTLDDQVARWAHVLQPAVDTAYSRRRRLRGGRRGRGRRGAPRACSPSCRRRS